MKFLNITLEKLQMKMEISLKKTRINNKKQQNMAKLIKEDIQKMDKLWKKNQDIKMVFIIGL